MLLKKRLGEKRRHWPLFVGGIGLIIVAVAGCTQQNALQLPPFPQPESVVQALDETAASSASANSGAATESSNQPTETPTPMPADTPTVTPLATPIAEPTTIPTPVPLPGLSIFQFQPGEPAWYTVDDDVMGGVSDSNVSVIFSQTGREGELVEEYQMRFSGTMSLENNGGFSSVRSDWVPINLSGYDGILLRARGDGKSYRLRIRSAEFGSNISYNALFETEAEAWSVAYIPFDVMVPTRRGFVMDVGPLDPSTVASFGFMLSDKQPGEFALEVDWMRAVTAADVRALDQ